MQGPINNPPLETVHSQVRCEIFCPNVVMDSSVHDLSAYKQKNGSTRRLRPAVAACPPAPALAAEIY